MSERDQRIAARFHEIDNELRHLEPTKDSVTLRMSDMIANRTAKEMGCSYDEVVYAVATAMEAKELS